MKEIFTFGGIFLTTAVIVAVAIYVLRRAWQWDRGVDRPDGLRKFQETPVLRVGGAGLLLAFLIGFSISRMIAGETSDGLNSLSFVLLGSAFFVLGFLDDLYSIPSTAKFGFQISIALAAYLSGMRIETISDPTGSGALALGSFDLIFTIFWLVAIPNLINLIDGMDGLAGGVGLFLTLTLATIGISTGNAALSVSSVAMAGGIVAFLVFNLPPAKVYMGDGGAYLLGYFIAGSALITSNKGSIMGPILVVIIALGFPILDTGLAVLRRYLSGMPLMHADSRHLHHRLLTLGLSKRTILMVLYGVFAGLSLLGLAVFFTEGRAIPVVGMILVVALILALRFLGLPHTLSEMRTVFLDIMRARRDVRYAYSLARVLDHDLDRITDAGEYWQELRSAMGKLGIRPVQEDGEGGIVCEPGYCCVAYPVSNGEVWKLCCPLGVGRRRQWDRVIRCFHPALTYGRSRWGKVPADFAIIAIDSSRDLMLYEESLNQGLPQPSLAVG